MSRLRSLGPALVALALACTPAASTPDAGPNDANRPFVEIGTREGDVFTAWHDGDTVPQVRGPQGGMMITPAVRLDGALASGDAPELTLLIQNFTLPGLTPFQDFAGYGPVAQPFDRVASSLEVGPIFDQLSWNDVTGLRMQVRARVTTSAGLDARGQVDVVLGSPGAPTFDAGPLRDGTEAGTPDDAAAGPDAGS